MVIFKDIDNQDVIIIRCDQVQCVFGCAQKLLRVDGTIFEEPTSTILFEGRESGINVQGCPAWVLAQLAEGLSQESRKRE